MWYCTFANGVFTAVCPTGGRTQLSRRVAQPTRCNSLLQIQCTDTDITWEQTLVGESSFLFGTTGPMTAICCIVIGAINADTGEVKRKVASFPSFLNNKH
ncbi:unnamed protein product [Ostreobium quekettii]|uniref:Uncharacterized protein n=1 Tax=Ostreobium quekettii TaxID=121088 RepID=A0A8S1IRS4_9CHLO|nr:unnamed protein product [Ostreobium quekettii]